MVWVLYTTTDDRREEGDAEKKDHEKDWGEGGRFSLLYSFLIFSLIQKITIWYWSLYKQQLAFADKALSHELNYRYNVSD